MTSGNTSSQKSQTVGNFDDVIGRIGIISTLKVLSQTSQTSAIFTMSVNLAVLRIAIVVRIPVSGNHKNPRFLRFLGQVGTRFKKKAVHTQTFNHTQSVVTYEKIGNTNIVVLFLSLRIVSLVKPCLC